LHGSQLPMSVTARGFEVEGHIPTPPGDPDDLGGDGDRWACE
jgi:hypothetical protein